MTTVVLPGWSQDLFVEIATSLVKADSDWSPEHQTVLIANTGRHELLTICFSKVESQDKRWTSTEEMHDKQIDVLI